MLCLPRLLSLSNQLCGQIVVGRSIHFSRIVLSSKMNNENEERKTNSNNKEKKIEDGNVSENQPESIDKKNEIDETLTKTNPTFQIPLSRRFGRRKFYISPEARFQSLFNDSSTNVKDETDQRDNPDLRTNLETKTETDKQISSNKTEDSTKDSTIEAKDLINDTRNFTNDTKDSTDYNNDLTESTKDSINSTKDSIISTKDSINSATNSINGTTYSINSTDHSPNSAKDSTEGINNATKDTKPNERFQTNEKSIQSKSSDHSKHRRKVKPVNRLVNMIPNDYWSNVETDTKHVIDELENAGDNNDKKC